MRADEYEGPLNNTEATRQGEMREAEARKILHQNALVLTEDGNFLLWFQKYAYPVMAQRVPEHGADLERFMGRRALVVEIVDEMNSAVPGFIPRLFAARDRYESMLVAAERPREK